MIGRLRGTLLTKNPPQILVEVNGIGYELEVPMSTFYGLPEEGEEVTLHTHLAVREDGHFLYGFATGDEKNAFKQLLKVSGIGARTALAVLSGLSAGDLAEAVARQDIALLVKIPGIGKKTAERLLLELRDKFSANAKSDRSFIARGGKEVTQDDILHALLALGYREKEALAAMRHLPENTNVADGIRLSLKQLSGV